MELTGINLLDSIIDSTGVSVNAVVRATLAARLQQMIVDGTDSKMAVSLAMKGFWTGLSAVKLQDLMKAVETNTALIEAASDQAALDAIVFPSITDPGYVNKSADIGTLENPALLDAGSGNFKFTENPNLGNCVKISNFTKNDMIEITQSPSSEYSFSNDGADVNITNSINGIVSHITLSGVVSSEAIISDESSFEAAIGFNAFAIA